MTGSEQTERDLSTTWLRTDAALPTEPYRRTAVRRVTREPSAHDQGASPGLRASLALVTDLKPRGQ